MKRILRSISIIILCLSYSNSKAQPPVLNLNEELNSSHYSIHPNYIATEAINAQPGTHAVATNNTDQIHLYISGSNRMANPNPPKDSSDAVIKYGINVYPNPTNGMVTVVYHLSSDKGILQLYDVIGKLVGSFKLDGNNNAYEFDASYLCCGIFSYRVMDNETLRGQGKLVILR